MILAKFDKILEGFTCFYGILSLFLCTKCSVRKFACTKEFTFRSSAPTQRLLYKCTSFLPLVQLTNERPGKLSCDWCWPMRETGWRKRTFQKKLQGEGDIFFLLDIAETWLNQPRGRFSERKFVTHWITLFHCHTRKLSDILTVQMSHYHTFTHSIFQIVTLTNCQTVRLS